MFRYHNLALLLCFFYALFVTTVSSLHTPRHAGPHHNHATRHIHQAHHENLTPFYSNKQARTRNLTESELNTSSSDSVDRWIAANPTAASKIPAAQIEAFKQDLKERRDGKRASAHIKVEKRAPIEKRQNVTRTDLDNARAIVKAAQDEAGKNNNLIRSNPRLNNYSFKNKTSTLKTRSDALLSVNSTVAKAAAIVAEADSVTMAGNGTLYTSYILPGGFKSPPGHESDSGNFARSSENLQKRDTSFWMETVGAEYAGTFPLDPSGSNYVVWRNVKDYGATGDGKTDDTAAINKAISDGDRCGEGCGSTSVKGAVIYFPAGTYLVSTPIIAYYNTQLIGNPNSLPVILAAPGFVGLGVISSDVYLANGEWYINQSNFFRSVRNFILDLRTTTTYAVAGIHWQVAQATSLQNIYFWLNSDAAKAQVGIFAENGSGGFMSDLFFYGGSIGLQCGNQQFTTRNFIFIQCTIGISLLWDWGWTFKSVNLYQCPTGISIAGADVGGSIYLLDSIITGSTKAGIDMPASNGNTLTSNYLNIDNLVISGTPAAITQAGTTYLGAGDTTINSYVYGRIYDADHPDGTFSLGTGLKNPHPMTESLGGGPQSGYFERSKPQYETLAADAFINAKRWASADGKHDDTNALNMAFSVAASEGLAVYMPAGTYLVTDTVYIPTGSVIIGECWSQIMASGSNFEDVNSPYVMVRVGIEGGSAGTVEIQDLLFTVQGATAGAVLVEWNVNPSAKGGAAMWDSHFRVGGAVGSNLQVADCPKLTGAINPKCIAASLLLHLTSSGSAYLENMWAWTADHDLDDNAATQIDVYSARGILIESLGPTWLYGTASEHNVLYQYQLYNAKDIFMSMIQTESPYYPPAPNAPAPFTDVVGSYESDPDIAGDCDDITEDGCFVSWALNIEQSSNIQIGGAGLYSWFKNYDEDCVNTSDCQLRLVSTNGNTDLYMLNLYTIGAVQMVVPSGSSMNTATAKDNTNENAYPWLAVIAAWTDLLDTDVENQLCDWDDDRALCLAASDTVCDFSLKFGSLDELAAATGISSYCMDIYTLQVVGDMLPIAMANYSSVDNDYDKLFGYYVEYIQDLVPKQISAFMASGAPGNDYFQCVYNNNAGGLGTNSTAQSCPISVSGLETFYTIYYVPTDLDGFWAKLSSTYGIDQSWVKLGESKDEYECPSQRCEPYSHTLEGLPMPADSYTVPNPKEIITAALPNITALGATIQATRWDVLLGQWSGSNDDVVQVVSTPVFMIQQAIDSMATVKSLGQAQEDTDKKNLILEILSIVFIFIPFVGEALGVIGDVSAQLIRMIDLIGAAGNEALSIVDVVQSGGSAPMAILGVLLGVTDFRNPTGFSKMATARRDMSADDVGKIGTLFKANSDKLNTIVKACT